MASISIVLMSDTVRHCVLKGLIGSVSGFQKHFEKFMEKICLRKAD